MKDWESNPRIPIVGRRHILTAHSVVERRLFSEDEVYYGQIAALEHLLHNDNGRVDLKLHLTDNDGEVVLKGIPEDFVGELSSRIDQHTEGSE